MLIRHSYVVLILAVYDFALLAAPLGYYPSSLHSIIRLEPGDVSSVFAQPSYLGVRNILRHIVASVGFSILALSVRISWSTAGR